MESGETYDNQSLADPSSWKRVNSPRPGTPKQHGGQLPPVYFNTSDNPTSSASTPPTYGQYQKSPNIPQGVEASSAPSYPDAYQYAPSPGSGRMMQHPAGMYPSSTRWPVANQTAPQHASFVPHDRSRYARPPYPGYDPAKPYMAQSAYPNQPPTTHQTSWVGTSQHPQTHPAYADRVPRHVQADIAGPVVPAGLQALQSNNNNATLMQHQHTPMLVPNPHYNQTKAQSSQIAPPKNTAPQPSDNQRHMAPQGMPSQNIPANNPMPPSPAPSGEYYPAYPSHAQQNTVGPMHHNVGMTSPGSSPYPANPSTPGSVKSKGRGNKCYQCPKCVKVFRRGDHLKRHLLSVHDHEHPYQCGECGKGFASVPTLAKHAKSLHIGSLSKGLMCLRCQLTFKNITDLEMHATSLHVQEDEMYMQTINTSSKQHLCNTCSKAFSSAANLKRHMQLLHRTKDETKLFCQECGKGFSRSDNLQKHMERVHGGHFNGTPDLDDHDEAESVMQSETESRGHSADTDESSMSAPSKPWNFQPQAQPTHVTSCPAPGEVSQAQGAAASGYKAQYTHPSAMPLAPSTQLPAQPPPQTNPISAPPSSTLLSQAVAPHASLQQSLARTKAAEMTPTTESSASIMPQTNQAPKAPDVGPDFFEPGENIAPMPVQQQIEAKSVSEALSMAMKALSEFDYEVPGCESYPSYPSSTDEQQTSAGYVYQSYPYLSRMENGRSGMPNSTRPPGGTPAPQYGVQNYPQHGGNFLMNMPPPPGVTTAGHLPSAPAAGGQVVPQLSRLLQEGGGGVSSPMVLNDNNNSNLTTALQVNGMFGQNTNATNVTKNIHARPKIDATDEDLDATKVQMQEPQKSFDGETPDLQCNICKITYESIDSLMQHIEATHLKKKPHECCICQKKFAQAGNVKRHIRFVHLRERPFRCKDCSSTFDRLCYLQRHMRSHLQPNDGSEDFDHLKPCNCPECGKRCLTAHHLRGHMQRKHFAKNKQNYGQFLMKYRHLEAIGAGPGAITNPNRGRGGRKKKNAKAMKNVGSLGGNENDMPFSSNPTYSSSQPNSLSSFSTETPPPIIGQMLYAPHQQVYPGNPQQCKMIPGNVQSFPSSGVPYTSNGCVPAESAIGTPASMHQFQHHISVTGGALSCLPTAVQAQSGTCNGYGGVRPNRPPLPVKPKKAERKRRAGKRRVKLHRTLLPYRCQSCVHVAFSSLPLLKSHMSLVHRTQLKRHVCIRCGSSFGSSARLRSHVHDTHRNTVVKLTQRSPKPVTAVPPAPSPPKPNRNLYQGAGNLPPTYSMMNTVNAMSYLPPQNSYLYGASAPNLGHSIQPGYVNTGHHFPTPLPLVQT